MAQTKRKRPGKHRGNAAGMIEARGRPGHKPTENEKRRTAATASSEKGRKPAKPDRYASPPTWRGAVNRAVVAAVLVVGVSLLFGYKPATVVVFFPLILLIYIPLGFYTDQFVYNRRQRQKVK